MVNVTVKDAQVPLITWADRPSLQNQCGHALQQTHNLTDTTHTHQVQSAERLTKTSCMSLVQLCGMDSSLEA